LAAVAAAQTGNEQLGYLWPCNVIAWGCWSAVQTQWRVGQGGATGLDYAGVGVYLAEAGHLGQERKDIFKGICAAERATLDAWALQRAQKKQ